MMPKLCSNGRHKPREPLSAWLILGGAFCVAVIIGLSDTVFPIFYDHAAVHYDVTGSTLAWSTSAFVAGITSIGLLTNPLISLHPSGTRIVGVIAGLLLLLGNLLASIAPGVIFYILSFGLLTGLGLGNVILAVNVLVCSNFDPNRGLATGILTLGFASGTILAPVLVNSLLDLYGLSGSLLLLSGVYAQSVVLILACTIPVRNGSGTSQDGTQSTPVDTSHVKVAVKPEVDRHVEILDPEIQTVESHAAPEISSRVQYQDKVKVSTRPRSACTMYIRRICDLSLLRQVKFTLLVTVNFLVQIGRVSMLTYSVNKAIHLGVESHKAAYLTAIVGVTNLALRIPSTFILNFRAVDELIFHSLGVAFLATGLFIFGAAESFETIAASMVCLGALEGISMTAFPLAVVRCVGLGDLPKALALTLLMAGVGVFLTVPLAGWFVDTFGNYQVAFYLAGGVSLIALSLNVLLVVIRRLGKEPEPVAIDNGDKTHVDTTFVEAKDATENVQTLEVENR